MNVIEVYGLLIWLGIALWCVLTGAYLTARRRRASRGPKHVALKGLALPQRRPPVRLPSRSPQQILRFCPACGKQEKAPGTNSCWFCGYTLGETYGKRLPDEEALERRPADR
ncbi:MAG TPA: hypothetical protein VFV38_12435 [Ktedonobacteraceae bacterium]|nr:hypothetical protein [Ktedonobacteraceae bacterium]